MSKTKAKVTVKGREELAKKFKQLKAAAQGQALVTAAQAGILPIQNDAIDNAPYVSGTLSRSIHSEVQTSKQLYAMVVTGTDVDYGARVEFGFNDTDSLGRSYHQAAQPYMRPAYDNKRQAAIDETEAALREIIEGAAFG